MSKFDLRKSKEYHDWFISNVKVGDVLKMTGSRTKHRVVIEVVVRDWKQTKNYNYRKTALENQGSGSYVICDAYYSLENITSGNSTPYAITEHMIDKATHKFIDGELIPMKTLYQLTLEDY